MPDLRGARVVVVGLGASGAAAARLLVERGAHVLVSESRGRESFFSGALATEMEALGVTIEAGGHREATMIGADLLVLSPGVPPEIVLVRAALAAGVEVIGEFELACRHISTPVAAVTGTNGKTTTTRLLAHLLESAGRKVFCGGNVGTPLSVYANGTQDADVVVAEVSSFQLDTCVTFKPRVAVLLNVAPDHLDRYPGMEAYARSKGRVFLNQDEGDVAVINEDDPWTPALGASLRARRLGFSSSHALDGAGAWLEEGKNIWLGGGAAAVSFPVAGFPLQGRHNLENCMAALLAAVSLGATPENLQRGLEGFAPLAHRCQLVRVLGGRKFYDDSKGTNVHAVVSALRAVGPPVVLIAGGRDKGGGYADLAQALSGVVVAVVTLGEAAPLIENELAGLVPLVRCASMEAAVAEAARLCPSPGSVLLSPACSSFDMYRGYAERGEHFRRVVEAL
ncbi:MAG: UDP-N-acetylmuramoyl-L-alanine--D-glutamate ligase [Pseudomonadota bacterium]